MSLFILPLAILSIFIYLSFSFFTNSTLFLIIFILIGIISSFFVLRKSFQEDLRSLKEFIKPSTLSLILLILFVVTIKAIVISPFTFTKKINNFEHIQVTPVGDYYKNAFFVSALAQDGIPPKNPYFPASNLSYYLGIFFIPAALVNIFHLSANWVFYIFTIIYDSIALLLFLEIILNIFKSRFYQTLALALVISGTGVNTIPSVFNTLGQGHSDYGLQLNSLYDTLLFVPQHFLPATISVWIVFRLIRKKLGTIPLSALSTFILLSTTFVSLVYVFWLFILFLAQAGLRRKLILAGLLTLFLLVPSIIYLSDRTNIFYFYKLNPYFFTQNYILNIFLTLLIAYGPLLIIIPMLCLFTLKKIRYSYFLAFILPVAIAWFIRSPRFDDFSRRTLTPLQFALPIVYICLLQNVKSKKVRSLFILLTILTILIGAKGFYLDYADKWRSRTMLLPKDSEIILKIRSLPKQVSLAAIDRDRWVELTPSLAFKKIASPYLFDSIGFLVGNKISEEHTQYESQAVGLFIEPLQDKSLAQLIENKNHQLALLHQFFARYPRDLLLVNNRVWIKKDTNPWLQILKDLGVKNYPLTPHFTAFNYADLLDKTASLAVSINFSKGIKTDVSYRRVKLPEGLQFLATCQNRFPSDTNLEFEDYNSIFHKVLQKDYPCIGQLFYLKKSEDVLLTTDSKNVDYLYSFPVEIKENLSKK